MLPPGESEVMTDKEPRPRQRTVGRLDRSRDPAILDAALAELSARGYRDTNMSDIARAAGVGKAAIYRRWSSKAALISDVLLYWRPNLAEDQVPDTGSLRGDLDALIIRIAADDDGLISNDLIIRVALEATQDPELVPALDQLLIAKGRRTMHAILAQAVRRGDIVDRDWTLVADVVGAMAFMRVLSRQSVDVHYLRNVIETLVLPAVSSDGRLA